MKKLVLSIALGGAMATMTACSKTETAAENAAANVADANAAEAVEEVNTMGDANAAIAAEPIDNAANAADAEAMGAMSNEGDKHNGDRSAGEH